MDIGKSRNGARPEVTLIGRLDTKTAPQLEDALGYRAALAGPSADLEAEDGADRA